MSGSDFKDEDERLKAERDAKAEAARKLAADTAEANRRKADEELRKMGQGDQS